MTSSGSHHLSLFSLFVLLLLLSPQTQARESKFFSLFSHFTKEPQVVVVVPHQAKPHPSAPAPSPTESSSSSPAPAPAPTESILAPQPAEPEFVDRGDAYGLYGTTSLEENNEKKETFKTEYPTTRLYDNNNNEEEEEYKNNNQEYYNYNHGSSNSYANNFNQDRFYSNNNNYYYKNAGYEKQGMSDTRYVKNGNYFHDIKGQNQNYNNYKAPERGSNAYYDNNYKYPNEFDTMDEYYKQQESQGYLP